MKKITAILLMALMVLSLTACGNQTGKDNNGSEGSTEPTSVTITTLNGQKEQTQLEVLHIILKELQFLTLLLLI